MGIIDMEDLAGIHMADGQIICADCIEDKSLADAKEDDVITQAQIENADTKVYFCDACKARM